jgi:hypothetical protein
MTKKEKVIKGLECCAVGAECDHCPYSRLNDGGYQGCYQMHQDALAMLKAQEPMVPVRMNHTENKYRDHYRCPICKEDLSYEQNYCPDCGRAVKWE